jgi:signal transduction histidine kinase
MLWRSDLASSGLANLETAMLRQYFRLEKAERSLSVGPAARIVARAAGRRRAGLKAQRQVELERQRLGRELHTGVGQMLAAMRLQLDIISEQLPHPPEAVLRALERLSLLAREALDQVRALSRRLHPPEWQRLSLEDAIRQLWDLSGIPQRFEASLRIESLPQQPDLPVKILLYRGAQEALSNLTRHSKATRVEAVLETRGDRLVFSVQDNGVGFDPAMLAKAPANVGSGLGLRSIRDQATSLAGDVLLESGSGGTKLTIFAPFRVDD